MPRSVYPPSSISAAFGLLFAGVLACSSFATEPPEALTLQSETIRESASPGLTLGNTSVEEDEKTKTEMPGESKEIPEPSFLTVLAGGAGLILFINHWRGRRFPRRA
jgi:hypothetical protein